MQEVDTYQKPNQQPKSLCASSSVSLNVAVPREISSHRLALIFVWRLSGQTSKLCVSTSVGEQAIIQIFA
jgi:hypothetical protein